MKNNSLQCTADVTSKRLDISGSHGPNHIRIKSYCENDRQRWDEFALAADNSSFFHLTGWKDIIEQAYGHKPHYLLAESGGHIQGILPLFELKSRLFGHSLVSTPFVVYGGVCALDENVGSALRESAATLGRVMGVDYVEMRDQCRPSCVVPDPSNGSDNPDSTDPSVVKSWLTKDLYVTFQREIYPDADSNFDAIPRKQRRMIRQGMKAGFTSRAGGTELLSDFYNVYARNLRDLGTPVFPIGFFENIMKVFPQTFILSVWKGDVMAAGVMTFIYKDRLMPYFGGALREYFKYAISDFMYWELMRYGCEKGHKVFDFGRSKKGTGSFDFKRHWGFEPEELPYAYYLVAKKEMPEVNPLNPKYSLMINMWKRLPLKVANWLGPKIVRNIP